MSFYNSLTPSKWHHAVDRVNQETCNHETVHSGPDEEDAPAENHNSYSDEHYQHIDNLPRGVVCKSNIKSNWKI